MLYSLTLMLKKEVRVTIETETSGEGTGKLTPPGENGCETSTEQESKGLT